MHTRTDSYASSSCCNNLTHDVLKTTNDPLKKGSIRIGHIRHYNSTMMNRSSTTSSTGSLLTPEEKREIFLRKSQHLHDTMDHVLGEQSAARATVKKAAAVTAAAASNVQRPEQQQQQQQQSRSARYNQAFIQVGITFVIVVLAGQSMKSSISNQKNKMKLEAALEVLETKRLLLQKIQNEADLRLLAQQCVHTIQQGQTSNQDWYHPTVTTSRAANKKSRSSSWNNWIWGIPNTNSESDIIVSGEDDFLMRTDATSGNSHSALEEQIYQVLSNYVHQVVGDEAFTDIEKEKQQYQAMATATTNSSRNSQITKASTKHDESNSMDLDDMSLNEKLLQELLLREQQQQQDVGLTVGKDEQKNDTNREQVVIKKHRIFQI
jgi:hypothetical protein